MSFSDWRDTTRILISNYYSRNQVIRICEAAYKAGQRDGMKKNLGANREAATICKEIAERRRSYATKADKYRAEGAEECMEELK